MRSLFLVLVAAPIVASAQTPVSPGAVLEGRIRMAYDNLKSDLFVGTLAGVETIGRTTTRVDAVLMVENKLEARGLLPRLEMRVFRNGAMTERVVGDGTTLWIYNATRNEFSTRNYGPLGAQPLPETMHRTLMSLVDSSASGMVSNLTRLARQLYGEMSPRFVTWTPALAPEDRVGQVLYWSPTDKSRWVLFKTSPTDLGWQLDGLEGYEERAVRSSTRTMRWTIDVSAANAARYTPDFRFVAPTNARPIAGGS